MRSEELIIQLQAQKDILNKALILACQQLHYRACVPCDFNKETACQDCIYKNISPNDFVVRAYNFENDETKSMIEQYLVNRLRGIYE